MEMFNIKGKTVYKAIARGPILVMDKQEVEITDAPVADVEAEVARVKEAVETAKEQIGKLYENGEFVQTLDYFFDKIAIL